MSENFNITMTNTIEESKVNGVKMMVYGESGMGKTVLGATMPTPFIISAESGLLSVTPGNLRRIHGDDPTVSRNIPVIKVATLADFREAVRWAQFSHEALQYESGVVDSATEILELILKNALGENADGRAAYGAMHTEAISTFKNFRDIVGLNVYMSSKLTKRVNEITSATTFVPMAPGKRVGPDIPYLFDLMFALRIGSDEAGSFRYLQTQPCLQYEAKDRSGALLVNEEPHLGRIIDKIKASGYDPDDVTTHVYHTVDGSSDPGAEGGEPVE